MLSWGGLNYNPSSGSDAWWDTDPYPQGIGIFDMTDMEWKTSYDASADAYEPHASVRSFYENG
jgi:hypothetical protein